MKTHKPNYPQLQTLSLLQMAIYRRGSTLFEAEKMENSNYIRPWPYIRYKFHTSFWRKFKIFARLQRSPQNYYTAPALPYYRIAPHIRPWPYIRYKATPGLITSIRPWPYIIRIFHFFRLRKVSTLSYIRPSMALYRRGRVCNCR